MRKYRISYSEPNEVAQGWEVGEYDTKEEALKIWEALDPRDTLHQYREDYVVCEYDFSSYDDETDEIFYDDDMCKVVAYFDEDEYTQDDYEICKQYLYDENDHESIDDIKQSNRDRVEDIRRKYHVTEDNLNF